MAIPQLREGEFPNHESQILSGELLQDRLYIIKEGEFYQIVFLKPRLLIFDLPLLKNIIIKIDII
jgi:hypothetical protein